MAAAPLPALPYCGLVERCYISTRQVRRLHCRCIVVQLPRGAVQLKVLVLVVKSINFSETVFIDSLSPMSALHPVSLYYFAHRLCFGSHMRRERARVCGYAVTTPPGLPTGGQPNGELGGRVTCVGRQTPGVNQI